MADEFNTYYEKYYENLGAIAYTMHANRHTSRVLTLCDWLRESTQPGCKLADVGCGDMTLSTLVPERDWTGIDLNIEKARGKAIKQDLQISPYPFASGSLDGVVCTEVLEHLFDLRIVHKEVNRILKRGGVYLVSTPNFTFIDHYLANFEQLIFDPSKPHLFEHCRQYDVRAHTKFLNEAGFKVEKHTGADAHYSHFLRPASLVLGKYLPNLEQGQVDQIVGEMFPTFNHTIMLKAVKI